MLFINDIRNNHYKGYKSSRGYGRFGESFDGFANYFSTAPYLSGNSVLDKSAQAQSGRVVRQGEYINLSGLSSSYIAITNYSYLQDTSKLSFGMWLRSSDTSGATFAQYDSGLNKISWVLYFSSGRLYVRISDNGTLNSGHYKEYRSVSTTLLSSTNFQFFSVVFDADDVEPLKIFLGKNQLSVTKNVDSPISNLFVSDQDILIGANMQNGSPTFAHGGDFKGAMIYNSALTQLEIDNIVDKYKYPANGEVWDFEEESGTIVYGRKGDNGTHTNGTRATDNNVYFSSSNKRGYTDDSSVITPAKSSTLDAQNNPLQFTGKTQFNAILKSNPCVQPDGLDDYGVIPNVTLNITDTVFQEFIFYSEKPTSTGYLFDSRKESDSKDGFGCYYNGSTFNIYANDAGSGSRQWSFPVSDMKTTGFSEIKLRVKTNIIEVDIDGIAQTVTDVVVATLADYGTSAKDFKLLRRTTDFGYYGNRLNAASIKGEWFYMTETSGTNFVGDKGTVGTWYGITEGNFYVGDDNAKNWNADINGAWLPDGSILELPLSPETEKIIDNKGYSTPILHSEIFAIASDSEVSYETEVINSQTAIKNLMLKI